MRLFTGKQMKPLIRGDLSRSDELAIFDFGYAAGNCRTPKDFSDVLAKLVNIFPIDSVVCGFGAMEGAVESVGGVITRSQSPLFRVYHVECDANYSREHLRFYLEKNILNRDSQFLTCLRTQRPQLWMDLYQGQKHPFDQKTGRGFDADFVAAQHDYKLIWVLRHTPVDLAQRISNFSLVFRSREEAYQFSEIYAALTPYLHHALVKTFNGESVSLLPVTLSLREREVLRWVTDGKSNWEIGILLHVSEQTIKFHVKSLMNKYGAINRYQLIANAMSSVMHGSV